MVELMGQVGTAITGLFFAYAMFQQYFPYQFRGYFQAYAQKFINYFYPYVQIVFPEFGNERLERSEAYVAIRDYLSLNSSKHAKRLKADVVKGSSKSLVLTMADNEEVFDEFNGVKVWWSSNVHAPKTQTFSFYPTADEKRYYRLSFHKRHREIITGSYMEYVLTRGKEISVDARQRKLYTNNPSKDWHGWKGGKWSHVIFEHPANFDSMAMAKKTKEGLMKELTKFSKGKEYYQRIGKAWKRGYLLYGPPGTGKSTLVAAIANFMCYDVYDFELTIVKDNTELRKLLIDTTSKSVIVIEDIDCSLDLTQKRKPKKQKKQEDEDEEQGTNPASKKAIDEEDEDRSKKSDVTLSGLLNIIDGIWSACGGERIIIFTTNYVDKLDPALIRRGRMDRHIEMSFCCFEGFTVLARNYLKLESHPMFFTIEELLRDVQITPADIAEHLTPKSEDDDEETCLNNLISILEATREEQLHKQDEGKDSDSIIATSL